MNDDEAIGHDGILFRDDGTSEPARVYHGEHEECLATGERIRIDPREYAQWRDDRGTLCMRRGESASVGASPAYSARYDDIDWGN